MHTHDEPERNETDEADVNFTDAPRLPLTNYTLSTVCPACGHDTYKLACKVRCGRCGFMWDCSEL